MIFDYETLKLIWWLLIGVLLIGFAVTDGLDMGVGMLLPFVAREDVERRVVINTVGPHWDGNQVWLITAGGALFAAWPMVYAAAFSGFYFAMILVLFALFCRPLAFDYRSKLDNAKWRNNWDWALFAGSLVPALVFGVAFGNLFQGVPLDIDDLLRASYHGSFFALLNPAAILFGLVSIAMLVGHGGLWLQLRTDGAVAERSARFARLALLACIVTFAIAGVWVASIKGFHILSMPEGNAQANPLAKQVELIDGGWLANYESLPWTLAFPVLAFATAALAWLMSKAAKPALALILSSVLIACVILTAGFSLFPFVMPSSLNPNISLTLWDAVSSHLTLNLMFIVVVLLLPVVLGYTLWCYVKMWRTVTGDEIARHSHTSY